MTEGEKAVNKFNCTMEQSQKANEKKKEEQKTIQTRVSQSEKAGLQFPVGSIARVMREVLYDSYR